MVRGDLDRNVLSALGERIRVLAECASVLLGERGSFSTLGDTDRLLILCKLAVLSAREDLDCPSSFGETGFRCALGDPDLGVFGGGEVGWLTSIFS